MLDHSVDQPDGDRLPRVDRLGGEDHLKRTFPADEAGKPLRSAEGRWEPEADLRFRKAGTIAGDRQRRRLGDLAAGAKCNAVHRHDERLRIALDVPSEAL